MAGGDHDDDGDSDDPFHDDHGGVHGDGAAGYVVGYGRPPLDTRFRPGQSGNPAGRPKGPRGLARDLIEELRAPVAQGEGAARETLTRQRAILRALAAKAQEGDARATAMLLALIERLSWSDSDFRARIGEDEPL